MKTHTTYHVSRMSHEHRDWLRALTFYKQEISILQQRLSQISILYSNEDVKSEVEHFQNVFVIQNNNIDNMTAQLKQHESHMNSDVLAHAQHLTKETLDEHESLRDAYIILEKTINEHRHEFNRFLAKYM
jgi:hypothetical protein